MHIKISTFRTEIKITNIGLNIRLQVDFASYLLYEGVYALQLLHTASLVGQD